MTLSFSYTLTFFFGLLLVLCLHLTLRRRRSRSITNLPGPPPGPWLVGNVPELTRPMNVGDADFSWMKTFGNAVRIKGTFGRDVLFITDPKAFQFILNSYYKFPKSPELRLISHLLLGKGLVWAEGAQHSRHRRLMDAAFTYGAIKEHLPLFQQTVQQTVAIWKDIITHGAAVSAEFDIPLWMSRTTLDMLGATAFDYSFGALRNGKDDELYRAYENIFVNVFHERSDYLIAFETLFGIAPPWLVSVLFNSLPNKIIAKVKNFSRIARRVSQSLVDRQLDLDAKGKDKGRDILSLLVNANLSASSKDKLSNDELLAQLTTLMVSGHETTASLISWALYSLSLDPKLQSDLREEIKAVRARAVQRGNTELTAADLSSMRLLEAVLKETLRYHPILPQISRIAGCDAVIPLSTPQRTKTGQFITEVPVSKGQSILLSVAAFNRLPSLWGEDADVWRPQRFLEPMETNQKSGVGVYANIASFSSGGRSCIGWRFAMIELQVMLVELIENFEFAPPPGNIEILRAATTTMSPVIKGSKSGRAELPLTVTPLM